MHVLIRFSGMFKVVSLLFAAIVRFDLCMFGPALVCITVAMMTKSKLEGKGLDLLFYTY